jgi:hypothetical protein
MKLFKTIGIAMLAISICTGCTNNTNDNLNLNSTDDLEERKFDIDSTTEYKVADIKFKIPDYFDIEDTDDPDIKHFFDNNSKLPILSLQKGDGTLSDDTIEEYINDFVNSSDGAFNNFTNFTSVAEKTKISMIPYTRAYADGDIVLKDNSKLNADLTFYFISNNKKDKFVVFMYIQYDGLKYDYEYMVHQIIQNIEVTDKKGTDEKEDTTNDTSNSTTNSSDNSSDTPTTTPSTSTPSPTVGQKNALNRALDYLDYNEFSRKGLIDQLLYDGYTQEEAEYGADHTNANWDEEAALKAMDYLSVMSFSRQGLIEQLMFDGFTQEQAEYGVTRNGY